MSYFFNPGSPRFRRGAKLVSAFACMIVGSHVVLSDFGKQDHVFSHFQRATLPEIDKVFGITEEEIKNYSPAKGEKSVQWLQLKKKEKGEEGLAVRVKK